MTKAALCNAEINQMPNAKMPKCQIWVNYGSNAHFWIRVQFSVQFENS